jgi:hypothetical protein
VVAATSHHDHELGGTLDVPATTRLTRGELPWSRGVVTARSVPSGSWSRGVGAAGVAPASSGVFSWLTLATLATTTRGKDWGRVSTAPRSWVRSTCGWPRTLDKRGLRGRPRYRAGRQGLAKASPLQQPSERGP